MDREGFSGKVVPEQHLNGESEKAMQVSGYRPSQADQAEVDDTMCWGNNNVIETTGVKTASQRDRM